MGRKPSHLKLFLYQQESKVGELVKSPTGALSFQYSDSYLVSSESVTPLSLSLPLREEEFRGDEVYNFFENLLPDNPKIREQIAKVKKTGSTQSFDLLQAIGADCVGALQFLTKDQPTPAKLISEPLTEAQIEQMLQSLQFHPLGMEESDDFRISIAGAQEKTALLRLGDQWHRPLGSTPTTHIFKPPMGQLQNGIDLSTSVENEWLCLQVCKHLGLPVAEAEIHQFGEQSCLVVQRFDRLWEEQKTKKRHLKRIPQEDLCQALNVSSSAKYESDGGPGIQQIMNLLIGSDYQHEDRLIFLRAQIVNYLLAATDGHAKNYSLFLTPTGFYMTPIYDVLSAYPALEEGQIQAKQVRLAMAIGEKHRYRHRDLTIRHFEQTAKLCGISITDFEKLIEDLSQKLKELPSKILLPKECNEKICNAILDPVFSFQF